MIFSMKIALLGALVAAPVFASEACPPPGPQLKENLSTLQSLQSNLKEMTSAVQGFDKSKGIGGALAIQRKESDVASAADTVSRQTMSLGPLNNCDSGHLADTASSVAKDITELVKVLGDKKDDFQAVNVGSIVNNDAMSLYSKTTDWERSAYSKMTCSGQAKIAPIWDQMNQAFATTIRQYGGSPPPAPGKPSSCRQE